MSVKKFEYQFLLTDTLGQYYPDGNYSFIFAILNDSTEGDTIWSENRLVTLKDGFARVVIGEIVPLTDTAIQESNRWLGFNVDSDLRHFPRTRLSAVLNSQESQMSGPHSTIREKRTREGPRTSYVEQDLVLSIVHIIEDTLWIETPKISYSDGNVFIKKLTLPAGLLNRHFNVLWYVNVANCHACNRNNFPVVELKINGKLAAKYNEKNCSEIDRIFELSFFRKGNSATNEFVVTKLDTLGHSNLISIDTENEVVFSIIAYSFGESSNREYTCIYDLTIGSLVIQFSGDTW